MIMKISFRRFRIPKNKRPREDPRPGIVRWPRAFRSARGSLLRSRQGARADLGEVEVPEEPEGASRHAHDVPPSLAGRGALVKRRFYALPRSAFGLWSRLASGVRGRLALGL